jgi:hypothetical protein
MIYDYEFQEDGLLMVQVTDGTAPLRVAQIDLACWLYGQGEVEDYYPEQRRERRWSMVRDAGFGWLPLKDWVTNQGHFGQEQILYYLEGKLKSFEAAILLAKSSAPHMRGYEPQQLLVTTHELVAA